MNIKRSSLIVPISIVADLAIIHITLLLMTPDTYLQRPNALYYTFSWLLITTALDFYPTRRKENFFTNIHKMFNVYTLFGSGYFAIFGFGSEHTVSNLFHIKVLSVVFMLLTIYRILFYWTLRNYSLRGGNYVSVVAIGRDRNRNLIKIRKVFDDPYLGYRYNGFFDDSFSVSPTYLGEILRCTEYILNNEIDEVYCLASKFSQNELRKRIDFADNTLIKLKNYS